MSLCANILRRASSPYLCSSNADNPVHWQPWSSAVAWPRPSTDVPIPCSRAAPPLCRCANVMPTGSVSKTSDWPGVNAVVRVRPVAREKRPAIDSVYMTARRSHTGHGVWPMTVS